MTNFTKCNTVSGFYSSTDDISNFKFKVKLKEITKGIPILKTSLLDNNLQTENISYSEEKIFSWQEKTSATKGTIEITNNTDVSSNDENKSISFNLKEKLFSYVDSDDYKIKQIVLDNNYVERKILSEKIKHLSFHLHHPIRKSKGIWVTDDNIDEKKKFENLEKMFVLVDMNDYSRDPSMVLNREHLLFEIAYNRSTKSLKVSPDFNNIENNPYILEISYGTKQLFHYSMEQVIPDVDEKKTAEIIATTKIQQQDNIIRLRKKHLLFWTPPSKALQCAVTFEIRSGHSFEYDNLYVEYTIELPYGFRTGNLLNGKTQIAKARGRNRVVQFGHIFEFNFDYNTENGYNSDYSLSTPRVYFEIISSDFWGRKRTEGYCHTAVPIIYPGYRRTTLVSSRPVQVDERLQNMKRYFVGGRHTLKEVTSTYRVPTFQGDCLIRSGATYENSGSLEVGTNVVVQSRPPAGASKDENLDFGGTGGAFESVRNAIRAYRRTEEKLKST